MLAPSVAFAGSLVLLVVAAAALWVWKRPPLAAVALSAGATLFAYQLHEVRARCAVTLGGSGGKASSEPIRVDPAALQKEYRVWLLARALRRIGCPADAGGRCWAALEGWVMGAYSGRDARAPTGADGEFGYLTAALAAPEQLVSALERAKVDPAVARRIGEAVVVVREASRGAPPPADAAVHRPAGGGTHLGDFRLPDTPEAEKLERRGDTDLALLLWMRYSSPLVRAHRLTLPREAGKVLWAAGVRNIAFATPTAPLFPVDATGVSRFGIFEDVDVPAGLQAPVLGQPRAELLKLRGGWLFEPPFWADVPAVAQLATSLAARRDVFFLVRKWGPLYATSEPYQSFERAAVASRVLAREDRAYTAWSPGAKRGHPGGKKGADGDASLVVPPFATHLMYAGPRAVRAAEALLDRLLQAWPRPRLGARRDVSVSSAGARREAHGDSGYGE